MKVQRVAASVYLGVLLAATGACGDDNTSDADGGDVSGGKDSGSDNTGGGKDAGGGGLQDAGMKDAGMKDAGMRDAGMKDAGPPPPMPTCAAYCESITANCTVANEQYKSKTICSEVCASFPVGTGADVMGNTLGCRSYHADAAKMDAAKHCHHAGLTGGDLDVSDTMGGPCGEGCEAFCAVANSVCIDANKQWNSVAECLTACKTFKPSTTPFSVGDMTGDNFHCRAYHLTAAAIDPKLHCPHIAKVSEQCK